MNLSDAIAKIGNENVRFQMLDDSAADGAQKTKQGTKFSFYTGECGPEYLLGGHNKLCLIVWVQREKWNEVIRS